MARNIAIFCDGTWQEDEQNDKTNVAKLFEACNAVIDHPKPTDDMKFHIDGVGTGTTAFDRFFGGITGYGLTEDVKMGYKKICEFYRKGDRIYLIGFSRGAYTARSIAGLIGAVGIVNLQFYPEKLNLFQDIFARDQDDIIDEVFEYYRTPPKERDDSVLKGIRRSDFDPVIQAVGVFDTVGALGIPTRHEDSFINRRFQFHDVTLGSGIRNAFHAVAIDEQRYPFRATLWAEGSGDTSQNVQQVWFPGDHGDIGGGKPEEQSGLSNIALLWMAKQLEVAGLDIDVSDLKKNNTPGPEKVADTGMTGFWVKTGEYQRDVGYPGFAGQKIHEVYDWKLDPKNDREYISIANPLKDYAEKLERIRIPKIT